MAQDAVADARRDYWAALFDRDPRALWDAAQGLLAHARSLQPDFPGEEEREADFRAHIALRSKLDAAARMRPPVANITTLDRP